MKSAIIAVAILLIFSAIALAQDPPPEITITQNGPTAPGFIFLTSTTPRGMMIMDNSGGQIFWRPFPGNRVTDFKVQPNGLLSHFDANDESFQILNDRYETVDTVKAANGFTVDLHEFIIDDNGHYLFLIYDRIEPFDLSVYGGYMTATLVSTIIQELDTDKNVVFEWRDLDHIPISDTVMDLTTPIVDYAHGNAIEIDSDGNLLLSSRHLSEITKIDRQTGAIIWRLGGAGNQFTFTNDAGFGLQHHIRRLDNGHITLFDNGEAARGYSRGVEYEINEVMMTITRTWEVTGPFASCCGNAQRLPNGNTMIAWGPTGYFNEVTPMGDVVWEAAMAEGFSYRVFRFPWLARYYLPVMWKQ